LIHFYKSVSGYTERRDIIGKDTGLDGNLVSAESGEGHCALEPGQPGQLVGR